MTSAGSMVPYDPIGSFFKYLNLRVRFCKTRSDILIIKMLKLEKSIFTFYTLFQFNHNRYMGHFYYNLQQSNLKIKALPSQTATFFPECLSLFICSQTIKIFSNIFFSFSYFLPPKYNCSIFYLIWPICDLHWPIAQTKRCRRNRTQIFVPYRVIF